jgi:CO/xanthine dehydrogenase Mo-binding subunit
VAEGWPKTRRILGTKVKRLDGPDKATGRAKYTYDIHRPGLLHGMILRSPHAHAKIKSIDATAARTVPGFKALVVFNVARDVTVTAIDAGGKKFTYQYKAGKKEEEGTVEVRPEVVLIRNNQPVTLADLKPGDAITVESPKDAAGRELFYAGDEIAAVAADTEEHARDALRAIKVEYEVLDHVVSEEEAKENP